MYLVATVGPKSTDKWIIKDFITNGVNVLRLNCSHYKEKEFNSVVELAREIKSDILIMADLCGRKIRISEQLNYIYKLYVEEIVFFCGEDMYKTICNKDDKKFRLIPITLSTEEIDKNNITEISIKDGIMRFKILDKDKGIIKAKVLRGGIIRGGKGCNISKINRNVDKLNNKDKLYINWALSKKVDIICESYVESKKDIINIKEYIDSMDSFKPKIWGKVETPKGIESLNDILEEIDTIVIGRGDLIPEAGLKESVLEEMKGIEIIKSNNKEVIIATHVLDNMKQGHNATLPEIESIYNFIKCGVNGFMLAGETSTGKAPIKTVKFLNEIVNYYKQDS